jgi:hypothetical protein
MKKIYLFKTLTLCLVALFILSCKTQNNIISVNKTTMDLLKSTKWQMMNKDSIPTGLYIKYDKDSFNSDIYNQGKEYKNKDLYYLSDDIDTIFEKQKVGKNLNGRFIVEHLGNPPIVMEIIKITPTELVLRNIRTGVFLTHRAVKQ